MYIKFCNFGNYAEEKKNTEFKDRPGTELNDLTRFRLFRAVSAILSVICLILLVVIIALAMKLQTLSVCPDQLEDWENTDLSSICTVERCMATYPQGQVHASKCTRCGRGWVEFESFCFLHSKDRRTWSDSRSECQKRGGDLAVLSQDRVQNFLSQASRELYWIGLSRSHSGVWAWVDNSTLGKRNWSEQPADGDCAYLNGVDWAAAKCSSVSYFICQKNR